MPIDNLQFRAEIGLFYSVIHRASFRKNRCFLQVTINYLSTIPLMINLILSSDRITIFTILVHLICLFTTCVAFPLVILFTLIFSNIFVYGLF